MFLLQGVLIVNCQLQMAVTLKQYVSDPNVGKAKMYLKICLHFSAVYLQFFKKKLLPLKHILALPTWGQKCLVSEL